MNAKKNVYCIHPSSLEPTLGRTELETYDYYYHDKIKINGSGTEMDKIYHNGKKNSASTNFDYDYSAAFLARLFYLSHTSNEYVTTQTYRGYTGMYIFRDYVKNDGGSDFYNFLSNKGAFKYFIHNEGTDDFSSWDNYKKCQNYATFISNMNNKYTIKDKKHTTPDTAINNKEGEMELEGSEWEISMDAPYYKDDTYYNGTTYKYAYIDSNTYSGGSISGWNDVTSATASDNGYVKTKIKGSTTGSSNKNTLIIRCEYWVYTGLGMGFATTNGQERFVVSGKKVKYYTYIAYNIEADPNVTIKKEIVTFDASGNPTYQDSIDAEPGDTVIFKVTIKNENGAKTRVKLTDELPEGLTFVDMAKKDLVWQNKTNWTGFNDLQISKNGEIIRYIKCTVDEGVSGTKTNTATVEPVSGYKLDASDSPSKSDTASVNVLPYSYAITKTSDKSKYEYGETPIFTITVTNTGSTTIKNVQVTDNVPTGLTYNTWSSVDSGWSKNGSNNVFTYSGMITAGDSKEFTITYSINNYSITDVTKSGTDGTEEVTIAYRETTNTANITQVQNKNGKSVLSAVSNKTAAKKIGIYGYVYEITKTADKAQAEPGESITYTITVTNKRSTKIKNIQVTDVVFSEFESVTLSGTGWSEYSTNVYEYSGELGLNESASFKLECKVGEALLKNEDTTIPNRATLTSVSNAIGTNGFGLETGIYDEVSTTIPGYDAVLSKYIKTGSEGTARASMTNEQKKNSPVIVKKDESITYVIKLENTASGSFYSPEIIDILPDGLIIESYSDTWETTDDLTTPGNKIFTYKGNGGVLPGNSTQYLEITCKVTMSNMYLPNIVNEVTYGSVKNKNGVEVSSVLSKDGANKEEIRLGELDIEGTVWNDDDKDGIIDSRESKMSDVEVILYDVTNGKKYDSVKTNENGKYSFSNVKKGKDCVPAEGPVKYYSTDVYNEYYLEFKYNGITYQSTPVYANQSNLTGKGNYDEEYPIDSNAAEKTSERNNFNNSLETISYNKATATSNGGGQASLKYEKNNNTSILKEINGVDVNRTMSAYSFINLENETIDPLWLYTSVEGGLPETDYLKHINLGLYDRGINADLEVTTTLDSHAKTINGQRQISYRPEEFKNNAEKIEFHQSNLYWTDYYYQVGNVYVNINEDIDGDGRLDISEDINNNGILDEGEDIDRDGRLDISEDTNNNGILDEGEDINNNGMLDKEGEDIDKDGRLDVSEDIDGDGRLDRDEDINGNGNLDNINLEAVRNYKTEKIGNTSITSESDTNLEYTFKTKILNRSTGVDAVVNEMVQYYDKNFEEAMSSSGVPFEKLLKLDTNDDGKLDKDYTYKTKIGYRKVKYDLISSKNEESPWNKIATETEPGVTYTGLDVNGNYSKIEEIEIEEIEEGTIDAIITVTTQSEYGNNYIKDKNDKINDDEIAYYKLFIQFEFDSNESEKQGFVLKPGETLEIFTTYMVGKDNNNRLNLSGDSGFSVISEISAYSTYFARAEGNPLKPSGTVDIDSNPGNLGIKTEEKEETEESRYKLLEVENISDKAYYEDDTCKSYIKLGLTDNSSGRKIKGKVWDDGKMGSGADGEYNGENGVAGVKVILCEVVEVNGQYFEIPALRVSEIKADGNPKYTIISTVTDSNGEYTLEGFFPGNYTVRFVYGYDGSRTNNLIYNGQDYKSTIYKFDDTNNFEENNNNRGQIGPSNTQAFPVLNNQSFTAEPKKRYSDARDDEKRRLEVMEYSAEMYNEKAEILKGEQSSNKGKLVSNTRMFADTATFIAKNENISTVKTGQDADVLICLGQDSNGTSFWYESSEENRYNDMKFVLEEGAIKHSATKEKWKDWAKIHYFYDEENRETSAIRYKTYIRNYSIENIDFGLALRPENRIELKKYIKQITLESSAGDVIVDLHYNIYNNDNTLKLNSDGILQPELNTSLSKGYSNVQALNNTLTNQGFRYINVDEELLQGAKISINYGFVAINNSDKDYISSNLYGTETEIQNLNTPLTTEDVKNAISAAIGNSTLKRKHENNYYGNYLGNWYYKGGTPGSNDVEATIKIDNILDYVDNSLVFSPIDNYGKWESTLASELVNNGYLKNDTYVFVEKNGNQIPLIVDYNNVEFQTESKNNLALTTDYKSSPMFKHLLTPGSDPQRNISETELRVSTILSAENESDDMVYENISEIIKFTTLTGRRTVSSQTVGNAKVNKVGYIDNDTSLEEPDTSITEKITLTPPTGADWIDTYVLTRAIIIVVSLIGAIVLGILFTPKLVTKIKNRKFIK